MSGGAEAEDALKYEIYTKLPNKPLELKEVKAVDKYGDDLTVGQVTEELFKTAGIANPKQYKMVFVKLQEAVPAPDNSPMIEFRDHLTGGYEMHFEYKALCCTEKLHSDVSAFKLTMAVFEPESELMNIEMKVVYPGNHPNESHLVNPENLVKEEKKILLKEINVTDPENYVLLLVGPNKLQTVLDDYRKLEFYTNEMTISTDYYLEVKTKDTATTIQAKPVNADIFNISMK